MILNLVDELGRMFQTHTYGDAFCLDIYLCRSEIAVYIAGTMACCCLLYTSELEKEGGGTKVERYNKGADAIQALLQRCV